MPHESRRGTADDGLLGSGSNVYDWSKIETKASPLQSYPRTSHSYLLKASGYWARGD